MLADTVAKSILIVVFVMVFLRLAIYFATKKIEELNALLGDDE